MSQQEILNLKAAVSARIVGQVFRSDNGQPVSSDFAWFAVHLFDASGNHIDNAHPNTGGFYVFHLPGGGDYYLTTDHDRGPPLWAGPRRA